MIFIFQLRDCTEIISLFPVFRQYRANTRFAPTGYNGVPKMVPGSQTGICEPVANWKLFMDMGAFPVCPDILTCSDRVAF